MFSNSLLFCVVIFFPLLIIGQTPDDADDGKKIFTATCSGKNPGLVKFFKKAYGCNLNASSQEQKKVATDCYKEVNSVDEPSTYEGQQVVMCQRLKEGNNFFIKDCEVKKIGEDAYKAREQKMKKCMAPPSGDLEAHMILLSWCAKLNPQIKKSMDKHFECQQKFITPALKKKQSECWKRQNETWPDDLSSQKKIICNDVDKTLMATECFEEAKKVPDLKPEADKVDIAIEQCVDFLEQSSK